MIIKKCTELDVKNVGEFYDRNVAHMVETDTNYPIWRYKDYPSVNSVEASTARGDQYYCLDGDGICGAFVLNENPEGAYDKAKWTIELKQGEYLVLYTLCIDYELAGRGLGKRAVEYCVDYARKCGYKAVRLDIVPSNIPAIRLYEKCDFILTDRLDLERNIPEIPEFVVMERVLL